MKEAEEPFEIILGPDGTHRCLCRPIRSERAKYMRIKVGLDGHVTLTMPRGVSRAAAERFLTEQRAWLRQALLSMKRKSAAGERAENVSFPDRIEFGFFPAVFRTEYHWMDTAWQGARLDREQGTLIFSGAVLDQTGTLEAFRMLLKRTAEAEFPALLSELSKKTDIPFAGCAVRLQARRWGSCSAEGHISLNALLLLFPRELTEYVMIHELCHRREMNHSARFWALVGSFVPDWRIRRARLNARANALPRILR